MEFSIATLNSLYMVKPTFVISGLSAISNILLWNCRSSSFNSLPAFTWVVATF